MASLDNTLACLAAMTVVWTLLGWPIAERLFGGPAAILLAPALGFAVQSAVALPLLRAIGMGRPAVLVVTAAGLAASLIALRTQHKARTRTAPSRVLPLSLVAAVAGAALLALLPAAAALPKATAEGVTLAASIFDHSKVAMIDEMVRSGVPPQNPFVASFTGEAGAPVRLAYYYLWHFSAAVFAVLTGASGWEADAALTGFTAFASLLVMFALTLRLGARRGAPFLVLVLAASASLRPLLDTLMPRFSDGLLTKASGLGGWLFQTAWAPQHVASASCTLLAGLLLVRLARADGWLAPGVLGLVAAAGYQTSIWVGGVTFAAAAAAIAAYLLVSMPPPQRPGFALRIAGAAALALALSLPFLLDQTSAAALRGGGFPIAVAPVGVLGPAVPASVRTLLDLPAYWLLYLPVEFPAFSLAGLIGLVALLRTQDDAAPARSLAVALALLAAASLGTGWLLRSTVAFNNDLGWRAVLPGMLLLIAFAARAISQWPQAPARVSAVLAALGATLALPDTVQLVREDLFASPTPTERSLAAAPALWQAVRRHAAPDERVASNPKLLGEATPWPINISWALMGNRRSCYASDNLAIAFSVESADQRDATTALFDRVFAGAPVAGDLDALAGRYGCDVVVVTPQDGAWRSDPFATSALYRLLETKDNAWRLYRLTQRPEGAQMPANQLKPRSSQ